MPPLYLGDGFAKGPIRTATLSPIKLVLRGTQITFRLAHLISETLDIRLLWILLQHL
jgi:hypothetical protein